MNEGESQQNPAVKVTREYIDDMHDGMKHTTYEYSGILITHQKSRSGEYQAWEVNPNDPGIPPIFLGIYGSGISISGAEWNDPKAKELYQKSVDFFSKVGFEWPKPDLKFADLEQKAKLIAEQKPISL